MLHTSVLLLCGVVLLATTISDAQSILNHPDSSPSVIQKGCPCPKILSPVCGSNGQTYSNNCLLECARRFHPDLQLFCNGRCPCQRSETIRGKRALEVIVSSPGDFASCSCITLYAPVCGSDGVTYSNSCFLSCESLRNPDLTQVKTGAC